MKPNPVGWFEIYVQDLPRARKFYETVLGTTLTRLDAGDLEMWAFPMAETGRGISGTLLSVPGVPSGGNSTLVYFSCEDCAEEAGRVAGAGGKVQRGKMAIGQYGHVAMAYDTEGNLFGLHSMK
jgi:predicted enzyme related to lactoylglutathione lyase